jgi:hypothetical protein
LSRSIGSYLCRVIKGLMGESVGEVLREESGGLDYCFLEGEGDVPSVGSEMMHDRTSPGRLAHHRYTKWSIQREGSNVLIGVSSKERRVFLDPLHCRLSSVTQILGEGRTHWSCNPAFGRPPLFSKAGPANHPNAPNYPLQLAQRHGYTR